MTDPAPAPVPADQWMLRAPAGPEYGPVPFDTLRAWAAQNRFTAGYSISSNRKDWQPVEAVPELGMDWFVEPGDGSRYGPFHPLALLDYIREGAVPPETKVIHKGNGGVARAYQVLLEAFVDAIDQTGEVQAELVRQIQGLQERLEERDRWFEGESRSLQEERDRRSELELTVRRLEEQGSQAQTLQDRLGAAEGELAKVRRDLELERRAGRETRDRLEQELKTVRAESERRLREQEQRIAADESKLDTARREKEALALQLEAGKKSFEADKAALAEQARSAEEEARRGREELLRLRHDFESRLNQAETLAAESAAQTSRVEAQLAALQGKTERIRREAEQAESAARSAQEIRSEAQALAVSVKAGEAEKAALKAALEKERQAVQEVRAEAQARLAGETQQREAAEALSREVTTLRRDNQSLQHQLETSRVEIAEAGRTELELGQARQAVLALRKKVSELEAEANQARADRAEALEQEGRTARESAAALERHQADLRRVEGERDRKADQASGLVIRIERLERDLESARDRVRFLEARLAERPAEAKPRSAWTVPPAPEGPAGDAPPPPPRKGPNLAGLEAQAQAELKAWQEKKQMGPKNEPPPKGKSWIPWK